MDALFFRAERMTARPVSVMEQSVGLLSDGERECGDGKGETKKHRNAASWKGGRNKPDRSILLRLLFAPRDCARESHAWTDREFPVRLRGMVVMSEQSGCETFGTTNQIG